MAKMQVSCLMAKAHKLTLAPLECLAIYGEVTTAINSLAPPHPPSPIN